MQTLRVQQYTLSISRKHSIILLCWRGKNREQRSFIPYISFVGFAVIFFSVWPWGAGNSCQVVGRTRRNPGEASSRGWMEREIGDAGKKYADKIYIYIYMARRSKGAAADVVFRNEDLPSREETTPLSHHDSSR